MIQLNVDFTLLNKYFGISKTRIVQYANKDIEEIMELEAANGNKKAENYEEILSDPEKLKEIFKLTNTENKLIILQNMSEDDVDNLLPYIEHDNLVLGLNYFTEEKLMSMCGELPVEEIIGMIFEKFTLYDVLSLMDESSMDTFLSEPDVERQYVQSYFEGLDQKTLEKIMMQYYGSEYEGKTKEEYLEELEGLEDTDFSSFILALEREEKINLIDSLATENQELLLLFKSDDLLAPMNQLMKNEKIELMSYLDDEFLIPMIEELPLDLTQIIVSTIDAKDFSEILASDFQDVLSSIVLFSTRMT